MPNYAVFLRSALCAAATIAIGACTTDIGFTKEQLETTLNNELTTGAGPDQIEAFFVRHEFPYSYDAMLRRYRSTLGAGINRKLDIYIYTDMEQKLTVAQVLGTETPRARPTTSLPRDLGSPRDGRF